jgi:transcription initiation factor TFIIIB Brf1 subunit/transcription initiation factor TFIIB
MDRTTYLKGYRKKDYQLNKKKRKKDHQEWVLHNLERNRELKRISYWRNRDKILKKSKQKRAQLGKQTLKEFLLAFKTSKKYKT